MSDQKYTREDLIAKINKLLALANDPSANEHQAAAASAKIQQWMQQLAITEDDLARARGVVAPKFITEDVYFLRDKRTLWQDQVAVLISKATMTHVFHNEKQEVYTFCGQEVDVKVAVHMYEQVRRVFDERSRAELSAHGQSVRLRHGYSIYNARQCRTWSGCHPTVYRQRWLHSWLDGAVSGLRIKLEEQRRTYEAEATSTALVVIETRHQLAVDWAVEKFKLEKPKPLKARLQFDDARRQGVEAGKNVEIRKGLEVDPPKQLT